MPDQATPKSIDLALQGGGSHGALTWGVLDRLLEDSRIRVCSISGTSAGAMNAVVVADGLDKGGADGGRAALERFWKAVSDAARWSPLQPTMWDRMFSNFSLDHSPAYLWFEQLTRQFSPYELNPFDINPLRDLLAATIDFEAVNRCTGLRVFVTATNVRTGRAKLFTQPGLSVDTVMASACLPFMFKAVEIDGEAYWDGGYIGNPALYPLVDDRATRDIVIVQINPLVREELPTTGRAIINRLNEVTFNSALLKELRSIHLLHELIDAEGLESERYRDSYLHLIHAHEEIQHLKASSKLTAEWTYLLYLKERGRNWAERFLDRHFDDLGVRSTLDLGQLFSDSFKLPWIDDVPTDNPARE
ncbi:patatin-like phospholipase family protein [Mesorhizobium xinjiangense]|uniref:patatin-like phospholipase family protein n=1 Tax=Mesorhizobium xinjiangense TaxID=2678685 RepID=UPI0012ECEE9D|nr:patatin-like phospholipase family protein [Mesorhizobium xinjiangense]